MRSGNPKEAKLIELVYTSNNFGKHYQTRDWVISPTDTAFYKVVDVGLKVSKYNNNTVWVTSSKYPLPLSEPHYSHCWSNATSKTLISRIQHSINICMFTFHISTQSPSRKVGCLGLIEKGLWDSHSFHLFMEFLKLIKRLMYTRLLIQFKYYFSTILYLFCTIQV